MVFFSPSGVKNAKATLEKNSSLSEVKMVAIGPTTGIKNGQAGLGLGMLLIHKLMWNMVTAMTTRYSTLTIIRCYTFRSYGHVSKSCKFP